MLQTAPRWRHTASMHTYMQNHRPRTPTPIGGTTVPEHAKHETRWVRR